jgi:hypothetical protein
VTVFARALVAGLLSITAGASVSEVGDDPAPPTLVLRVTDLAGLSRATLSRAEHELSLIYRGAGVVTTCVARSKALPRRADRVVEIILLSDVLAEKHLALSGLEHDDLGYALRPAQRAYILWPRIRDLELQLSRQPGEILGQVIAHEVGHLLLPVAGHSSEGIMRGDIDLNARHWSHFTAHEAEQIRTAVLSGEGQTLVQDDSRP